MKTTLPNMILVGGSHRKAGKTELMTRLIEKTRALFPLVCLKICCHDPNDPHDQHTDELIDDYWLIEEEPSGNPLKSSDRLYAAGASRVYRLITAPDTLQEGFQDFLQSLNPGEMVLVESNSIREYVQPGLFLFIRKEDPAPEKLSSRKYHHLADYTLSYIQGTFSPGLAEITLPEAFYQPQLS